MSTVVSIFEPYGMVCMNRFVIAALVLASAFAVVWLSPAWQEPFATELPPDEPYVVTIPEVLTRAECDALIAAASSRSLAPSEVGSGRGVLDVSVRKSHQTWFGPGEHPVTDALFEKARGVLAATGRFPEGSFALESIQVARYERGGKYDTHYDGDECDLGACPSDQRLATLLVYLSEPDAGGATSFPLLGTRVTPRKGHAVFFHVADPKTKELYEKTLHAGEPVGSGTKWIANVWTRGA